MRRDGPALLENLQGRAPVVFLDAAGRGVNSIDVSCLLKPFPLARFALHQAADSSLRLSLQGPAIDQGLMRAGAGEALRRPAPGDRVPGAVRPGSVKLVPYTTELPDDWREAPAGYRTFRFGEIMHPVRRGIAQVHLGRREEV